MTDVIERFWSQVQKTDGCWLWTGARTRQYGSFGGGKLKSLAHRWIWTFVNGPIPVGMCVLHRCDNPPCVRPDHLFLGTQLDNMRDMFAKGRNWNATVTHCPMGHAYDEANTYVYRNRRSCRRCHNERTRAA